MESLTFLKCVDCACMFLSDELFIKHVRSAHCAEAFIVNSHCPLLELGDTNLIATMPDQKCLMCTICHCTFLSEKLYLEHAKNTHCVNVSFMKSQIKIMNAAEQNNFRNPSNLNKQESELQSLPTNKCDSIQNSNCVPYKPSETLTCNFGKHERADEEASDSSSTETKSCELRPFFCSICGKTFRRKYHVKRHMLKHVAEQKISEDDIENCVKDLNERPQYSCSFCDKKFSRKEMQERHTLRSHMKKQTVCHICHKKVIDIKKHIQRIHEQTHFFICDVCGKKCKSKNDMTNHRRIHTGETPYTCNVCDRKFRWLSVLKKHLYTHSEERLFLCSLCGKSFRTNDNLHRHRLIHTSTEINYKCNVCGAKFLRKAQLVAHSKSHGGNKPHKCVICGHAFLLKVNLKTHLRTHTGEKPFKCDKCEKAFARHHSYKRHLLKSHTKQVIKVQALPIT